jgi:hypothetical protein
MPFYNVPGLLQLKPQSWLNPNAPYRDLAYRNEAFRISAGVFSREENGPRIIATHAKNNVLIHPAQPENGLLENHSVSIHNTRDKHRVLVGPALISSSSTLPLGNVEDFNVSRIVYSLVKYGQRAAIARHVMLNQEDQREVVDALRRTNNLADLKRDLVERKNAGPRYATLDLDEVFAF